MKACKQGDFSSREIIKKKYLVAAVDIYQVKYLYVQLSIVL